jgi:hypothetical protein
MPGGLIWPPVEGRTLLHEVARLQLTPRQNHAGDWSAAGGGWRFHSHGESLFTSADAGRAALIGWARVHASNLDMLSPGRALILADAGEGRYRLWQLVRIHASLGERLAVASAADLETAQRVLSEAVTLLVAARRAFARADLRLPATRWTIGSHPSGGASFVGLMPPPSEAPSADGPWPLELLEREVDTILDNLDRDRGDFPALAERLGSRPRDHAGDDAEAHLARALARRGA